MKFEKDCFKSGTSLQDYVTTSYSRLVEVFGEPDIGPNDTGCDKVTCEWDLRFEDGTYATIYDWKEYDTPFGEYRWHIGGNNYMAGVRVFEALGLIPEVA